MVLHLRNIIIVSSTITTLLLFFGAFLGHAWIMWVFSVMVAVVVITIITCYLKDPKRFVEEYRKKTLKIGKKELWWGILLNTLNFAVCIYTGFYITSFALISIVIFSFFIRKFK